MSNGYGQVLSIVRLQSTAPPPTMEAVGAPPPPPPPDMEARLTALETKWQAVVPTLATKADLGDTKAAIEKVGGEIHKMDASIKTWMIATVLAIIGTVVLGFTALFFNLSAAFKPATPAPAQPAPTVIYVTPPAPAQAPPPANPAASK